MLLGILRSPVLGNACNTKMDPAPVVPVHFRTIIGKTDQFPVHWRGTTPVLADYKAMSLVQNIRRRCKPIGTSDTTLRFVRHHPWKTGVPVGLARNIEIDPPIAGSSYDAIRTHGF